MMNSFTSNFKRHGQSLLAVIIINVQFVTVKQPLNYYDVLAAQFASLW